VVAFDSGRTQPGRVLPQSQRESGFLSDEEIIDLNSRATRRGKQGEGHSSSQKTKHFFLARKTGGRLLSGNSAPLSNRRNRCSPITASLLSGVRAGTGLEPERAF